MTPDKSEPSAQAKASEEATITHAEGCAAGPEPNDWPTRDCTCGAERRSSEPTDAEMLTEEDERGLAIAAPEFAGQSLEVVTASLRTFLRAERARHPLGFALDITPEIEQRLARLRAAEDALESMTKHAAVAVPKPDQNTYVHYDGIKARELDGLGVRWWWSCFRCDDGNGPYKRRSQAAAGWKRHESLRRHKQPGHRHG